MAEKNETESEEKMYSKSQVVEMLKAYGNHRELIGNVDCRGENFMKFCFRGALPILMSEYETKVPAEL